MNKVILMGRLTRDPELRYSQSANPIAIAKYGLAVRRQYAKQGEADVDFFNITAFGKAGEFANNYFKKGRMVSIVGRIQINSVDDPQKGKQTYVDIVAEEQHFAESKSSFEVQQPGNTSGSYQNTSAYTPTPSNNTNNNVAGFTPATAMEEDEDLPF
ncbi:MAG: single-stranded DNA-binding protein [Epulopiscium sp. Nuni2H_MBin003]|nr:MAG: single-stranded DNA-binding protein [Epulopiscium sp. Nuni2H_MBin003]